MIYVLANGENGSKPDQNPFRGHFGASPRKFVLFFRTNVRTANQKFLNGCKVIRYWIKVMNDKRNRDKSLLNHTIL